MTRKAKNQGWRKAIKLMAGYQNKQDRFILAAQAVERFGTTPRQLVDALRKAVGKL